jgi:predicted phage tail protein
MQDARGRLGIRAEQAAPAPGAPYVWDLHVFDFASTKGQDQLYSAVNVYYDKNQKNDIYALSQVPRPIMTWKHGVNKCLDLYVALAGASDAAALGIAIAAMMERQQISFTVPRVLYTCLPGDVIYFNRSRFPSLSGTAANLPVRILGISKLISSGKTEITAEVV